MSVLSFYSKIQLKIRKAEEEKKSLRAFKGFKRLGFTFNLKFRFLFWKTAKIIVRFFALLFGDSSDIWA